MPPPLSGEAFGYLRFLSAAPAMPPLKGEAFGCLRPLSASPVMPPLKGIGVQLRLKLLSLAAKLPVFILRPALICPLFIL